ncbi:MAG: dihydrofolate reductase [Catalinimonas sp.]
MHLTIIAAVADNGVIGRNNDLPWHLPDDLKFFKRTTREHACVMGRKVFESFGGALPHRDNIVVTRNPYYHAQGGIVTHSLGEGLARARHYESEEIFILGGGDVYAQAFAHLPLTRLYLTHVHGTPAGDVYFPAWDRDAWREVWREEHPADARHAYPFSFVRYEPA